MEPGGVGARTGGQPCSQEPLRVSSINQQVQSWQEYFSSVPLALSALDISLHVVSTLVTLSTEQISVLLSKLTQSYKPVLFSRSTISCHHKALQSRKCPFYTYSFPAEAFCTGVCHTPETWKSRYITSRGR